MSTRRIAAALITAFALVMVGCGTTTGSNGQTAQPGGAVEQTEPNQADIEFVRGMVPHHVQAVEMARMAPTRAQAPEIKDLAERIEAAQQPEIDTMRGWLELWGAKVPHTRAPTSATQGGEQGAHGMMSADQMTRLSDASGADFDRLLLELMIEHHEGAVVMAHEVIDRGRNPLVIALAREVIRTQEAEIEEMYALLPQG